METLNGLGFGATIITIYGKIKWVRVWNFKMNDVHASSMKYINVLLFYSVGILDTKSLGFRGTHNNEKIYIAIANGIVNYNFIQAFHKVCFTNHNFEILIIYSFVLTCSMLRAISIINTLF